MKPKTLLIVLYLIAASSIVVKTQTVTAYDLQQGVFNSTPVPTSAIVDPVDSKPILRFSNNSSHAQGLRYYVEAKVATLDDLKNGVITYTQFYSNNSISLESTTTASHLHLFRALINMDDNSGVLFTQANQIPPTVYAFGTAGSDPFANAPNQTTLDDLVLIDSMDSQFGQVKLGTKTLYSGRDPAKGVELKVIDNAFNLSVIDINPSGDGNPSGFYNWGDSLVFFGANNGTDGFELWRSDGTQGGTSMVKDINPGGDGSPGKFTAFLGKVFFSADDGSGHKLWSTDGTESGTNLVKDFTNQTATSIDNFETGPDGLLYFTITDTTGLRMLYKSDGTGPGTLLVTSDIAVTSLNGLNIRALEDGIYFTGYPVNDQTKSRLYKTDGTSAGTIMLFDVDPGGTYGVSTSFTMAVSGGYLYFTANDSIHGTEPWRTDGTTNGTMMLADIGDSPSDFPNYMTPIPGGGIYFLAKNSVIGIELYVADLGINTAIDELSYDRKGILYPNPTNGRVIFEVESDGRYLLEIAGVDGKIINHSMQMAHGGRLSYEIENQIPSGIYLISVTNNTSGERVGKKVLLER